MCVCATWRAGFWIWYRIHPCAKRNDIKVQGCVLFWGVSLPLFQWDSRTPNQNNFRVRRVLGCNLHNCGHSTRLVGEFNTLYFEFPVLSEDFVRQTQNPTKNM